MKNHVADVSHIGAYLACTFSMDRMYEHVPNYLHMVDVAMMCEQHGEYETKPSSSSQNFEISHNNRQGKPSTNRFMSKNAPAIMVAFE